MSFMFIDSIITEFPTTNTNITKSTFNLKIINITTTALIIYNLFRYLTQSNIQICHYFVSVLSVIESGGRKTVWTDDERHRPSGKCAQPVTFIFQID